MTDVIHNITGGSGENTLDSDEQSETTLPQDLDDSRQNFDNGEEVSRVSRKGRCCNDPVGCGTQCFIVIVWAFIWFNAGAFIVGLVSTKPTGEPVIIDLPDPVFIDPVPPNPPINPVPVYPVPVDPVPPNPPVDPVPPNPPINPVPPNPPVDPVPVDPVPVDPVPVDPVPVDPVPVDPVPVDPAPVDPVPVDPAPPNPPINPVEPVPPTPPINPVDPIPPTPPINPVDPVPVDLVPVDLPKDESPTAVILGTLSTVGDFFVTTVRSVITFAIWLYHKTFA